MNFLNLEYFLAAAEELNFTRAAKRLYISQQSLSTHITKLEEYFGARLFDRTPPLTLTVEGECLVRRARELLRMRQDTLKEIADIRDFRRSALTISSPLALGRVLLPHMLPAYHRRYPNVELRLLEGTNAEVESAVQEGRVDIAIGFRPRDCANLETEVLLRDRVLVMVPDAVLAQQFPGRLAEVKCALRETGDVGILRDCPFLLMTSSTRTGALSMELFRAMEITPDTKLVSRNVEMLVNLCLQNVGVLFCPEFFAREVILHRRQSRISGMTIFPLQFPGSEDEIAISYPRGKYLSKAAREFIRVAEESISTGPFGQSLLWE